MSASSRLTRFIDLPDGLVVDEALARAEVNLESHRETALQVIDQALEDLTHGGSLAPHDVLARLSDSIGSLAGMFQLDALSQAANRLGDLVRLLDARGASQPQLIDLHIAALRVLRVQTDPQSQAELLKGLDQIAAREARAAEAASR